MVQQCVRGGPCLSSSPPSWHRAHMDTSQVDSEGEDYMESDCGLLFNGDCPPIQTVIKILDTKDEIPILKTDIAWPIFGFFDLDYLISIFEGGGTARREFRSLMSWELTAAVFLQL